MNNCLDGVKIAFAMTGSFCTFDTAVSVMKKLADCGAQIIPVMSDNAYTTDTRFGAAQKWRDEITEIAGREIIHTIKGAEPIGPGKMADVMLVAPCTGNTLAKLAMSITDGAVTMAVKSHIRNARPVVLCIATNDALAGSAKNIGALMNIRNYYFVPLKQDDYKEKPTSLVADFDKIPQTIEAALAGKQIEPLLL
jgi:dipicolinate synthase subunit B